MSDKYRSVEHQSRSIMELSSRDLSAGHRESAKRIAERLAAAKEKAEESKKEKEAEIAARTRKAEKRESVEPVSEKNKLVEGTSSMSEKEVDEAKHTLPSVFLRLANKKKKHVKEYGSMTEANIGPNVDTETIRGIHQRAHASISNPANKKLTYSGGFADQIDNERKARKELLKRGIKVDPPKHKALIESNLGYGVTEDVQSPGTEARTKIKNVAREDNANPMNNPVRTKQEEINKKIIESGPRIDFGLSKDLINATRSILERITKVELNPETDERSDDSYEEMKKESKHTIPKTAKEKKLAALAHPKDKITHKDVLVGRGVLAKEEAEKLDETSYERDLEDHHPRKVSGVKGMKSKPFTKKFPHQKAMEKWMDSDDYGNHSVHRIERTNEEVEFSDAELEHINAILGEEELDEDAKKRRDMTRVNAGVMSRAEFNTKWGKKPQTTKQKAMNPGGVYSNMIKKLTKEELELDEARGRPKKSGESAEGDDTHLHPMQQLTKISLAIQGSEPHFEHKDGSKSKITKQNARQILTAYNAKRTSQEKDDLADKLHASRGSMNTAIEKHVS